MSTTYNLDFLHNFERMNQKVSHDIINFNQIQNICSQLIDSLSKNIEGDEWLERSEILL